MVTLLPSIVLKDDRGSARRERHHLGERDPLRILPLLRIELCICVETVVGIGEYEVAGGEPTQHPFEPLSPPVPAPATLHSDGIDRIADKCSIARYAGVLYLRNRSPVRFDQISQRIEQIAIEVPPFLRFPEVAGMAPIARAGLLRVGA